jgi:hypothetical protein
VHTHFVSACQAHFSEIDNKRLASRRRGHDARTRPMISEENKSSATIKPDEADPRGLADKATHSARALAEEGKENAAERIGTIASAMHGAAKEFEQQMPQGAELIRSAASTLESGAERLRQRSVDEWLQTANKFAHKEPIALFGGALLAGFALSRFLNSSRPTARAGDNKG